MAGLWTHPVDLKFVYFLVSTQHFGSSKSAKFLHTQNMWSVFDTFESLMLVIFHLRDVLGVLIPCQRALFPDLLVSWLRNTGK